MTEEHKQAASQAPSPIVGAPTVTEWHLVSIAANREGLLPTPTPPPKFVQISVEFRIPNKSTPQKSISITLLPSLTYRYKAEMPPCVAVDAKYILEYAIPNRSSDADKVEKYIQSHAVSQIWAHWTEAIQLLLKNLDLEPAKLPENFPPTPPEWLD